MSYKGHIVVDADCHLREYWEMDRTYKDNIDPEYRATYEQFSKAVRSRQRWAGDVGLGDLLWPRPPSHPMGVYDSFQPIAQPGGNGAAPDRATSSAGQRIDPACNWDPAIRLQDMDTAGIDVSVMFASQSDGFCMLNDVGFESALQRAYHRFMSAYCSGAKGRLRWLGNSNLRDIPETISQLRHWKKQDPSFAGMFVPRACPDGTMLDNPKLRPIFEASQELDMPIWIHGGANRPPLTPWVHAPNGLYHGLGGQYAMTALIGGRVFDLFPRLRIGIFESGGGWMPWLVEKLDDGFQPGSSQNPLMKRSASDIVAGVQLFCSVEADEEHIDYAVEALGEDVWLLSTDYPHSG